MGLRDKGFRVFELFGVQGAGVRIQGLVFWVWGLSRSRCRG